MLTIPMAHEGYFEFMRQQAEKLKAPTTMIWVRLRGAIGDRVRSDPLSRHLRIDPDATVENGSAGDRAP
jgi:hypothetical protein